MISKKTGTLVAGFGRLPAHPRLRFFASDQRGSNILQCGPGKRVFLTAIDSEDGQTLWETDEAYEGDKSPDDVRSWSTPVVAEVDGHEQIICAMATRVNGYDPDSGSLVWWC